MSIYIVLLFVIILCCILETSYSVVELGRIKIKTRAIAFFLIYIVLMLLGIFRNELLGVDVGNYKLYYERIQYRGFLDILKDVRNDNAYYLLNKIVSIFCGSFWVFKAILYAITFSIFSSVIWKKSSYVSLSFLIYIALGFIGINFCILRQSIAISICFWAFKFVKEKKLVLFFGAVLVAVLFHKTAIFYLLIYPIANGKLEKFSVFKKIFLFCTAIFCAIFVLPMLYQFYMIDYSSSVVVGDGAFQLFIYLLVVVAVHYLLKHSSKREALKTEYNAMAATLYFQGVTLFFSLFSRVTLYFSILMTIVIPNAVAHYKKKNFIVMIVIAFFSILYLIALYSDSCRIVPYASV